MKNETKILKLDYSCLSDELQFKHFSGVTNKVDFALGMSEEDAIALLKFIRATLRGEAEAPIKTFGKYEVCISDVDRHNFSFSVSFIECLGEKCKPLGEKVTYSSYVGSLSMLDGLRKTIITLEKYLED